MNTVSQLKTVKSNTSSKVSNELSRTGGLLRLAPAWVPRSFLHPGLRIKLHPDDTYAYGLNRGGIDECDECGVDFSRPICIQFSVPISQS